MNRRRLQRPYRSKSALSKITVPVDTSIAATQSAFLCIRLQLIPEHSLPAALCAAPFAFLATNLFRTAR